MVAREQVLLGLVEDVVVGGPFEVAVAVGPDVVAGGEYFVELYIHVSPGFSIEIYGIVNKTATRSIRLHVQGGKKKTRRPDLTIIVALNSSAVWISPGTVVTASCFTTRTSSAI